MPKDSDRVKDHVSHTSVIFPSQCSSNVMQTVLLAGCRREMCCFFIGKTQLQISAMPALPACTAGLSHMFLFKHFLLTIIFFHIQAQELKQYLRN